MIVLTGYPCPTCGMTTAFAHAVRGELLASFRAQPAGLAAAAATALGALAALAMAMTGKIWIVNWQRVSPTWVLLMILVVVLGGWAYKLVAGILDGTLPVGR